YFHMLAVDLMAHSLRTQTPADLRVGREMTIVVNKRNRPEPDVTVVRRDAVSEAGNETAFHAEDVVLAIEVVSPESEARDTHRKPQLYAEAGIRHFWRVEQGNGRRPIVYAYELDPVTAAYVPVGIFHDRLKLPAPFTIDIDLAAIDDM
ncbi:Uma2 family endonuclease, partial [Actinacidiphila acidipaludis]